MILPLCCCFPVCPNDKMFVLNTNKHAFLLKPAQTSHPREFHYTIERNDHDMLNTRDSKTIHYL